MNKNTIQHFKRPSTDKEREAYAKQYESLVYKIANQNMNRLPLSYPDLIGFGFEGLADAMNTYKEGSNQSFLQYAAYRIFYFIMNGASREGHIVRFSDYQQKKAKKEGRSTYIYQSIQRNATNDSDDDSDMMILPGLTIKPTNPDVGKVIEHIKVFVKNRFSARDADIFIQSFGYGKKDNVTGVQLAKQYGVSSAAITQCNKRIINTIKEDPILMEELEDLL